jgi:AraC family transcriptional regulator
MIRIQNNIPKSSAPRNGPFKLFGSASEYYKQVAAKVSDENDWPSLRLYKTIEHSNDLTFSNVTRNTMVVELTGTAKHLSVIEGKLYESPTEVNDICQMPMGLSARFAWETINGRQESLVLEFNDDLFIMHCPEFITDFFLSGQLIPSNYQQRPELSYLVRLLARELESDKQRGRLFADSVIRLLAIEIAQSAWSSKPLSGLENATVDKRIRHALDYIESNFTHEITLADLTQVSGLNATHLTNCFRKQVGATPYAHVVNRRIQQAVHLLNSTDQQIAQIALETGFADQQQMTHAFRRRLGRTPGSFRDKR